MNPAYYWLAVFLLAPIAVVAMVQWLVAGRISGKITFGWLGLSAYFLGSTVTRWMFGVTLWSLVVGFISALGIGLVFRSFVRTAQRASVGSDETRT
jgi:hypothetical protein